MRVRKALIVLAVVVAAASVLLYLGLMPWQHSYLSLQEARDEPGVVFLKPERKLVLANKFQGWVGRTLYSPDAYLVVGWRAYHIEGPDVLRGQVRIHSPEAALQYARLVTPCPVPPDSAQHRFEVAMEGDTDIGKQAGLLTTGWNCVRAMSEQDWTRNHLAPPTVVRVGDHFVVTRYLFTFAGGGRDWTNVVYRAEETVYADGRITRRVLQKQTLPGVKIHKLMLQ